MVFQFYDGSVNRKKKNSKQTYRMRPKLLSSLKKKLIGRTSSLLSLFPYTFSSKTQLKVNIKRNYRPSIFITPWNYIVKYLSAKCWNKEVLQFRLIDFPSYEYRLHKSLVRRNFLSRYSIYRNTIFLYPHKQNSTDTRLRFQQSRQCKQFSAMRIEKHPSSKP